MGSHVVDRDQEGEDVNTIWSEKATLAQLVSRSNELLPIGSAASHSRHDTRPSRSNNHRHFPQLLRSFIMPNLADPVPLRPNAEVSEGRGNPHNRTSYPPQKAMARDGDSDGGSTQSTCNSSTTFPLFPNLHPEMSRTPLQRDESSQSPGHRHTKSTGGNIITHVLSSLFPGFGPPSPDQGTSARAMSNSTSACSTLTNNSPADIEPRLVVRPCGDQEVEWVDATPSPGAGALQVKKPLPTHGEHLLGGGRSKSSPVKIRRGSYRKHPATTAVPTATCPADLEATNNSVNAENNNCDEDHEQLKRIYDMRTWDMYARITEARTRSKPPMSIAQAANIQNLIAPTTFCPPASDYTLPAGMSAPHNNYQWPQEGNSIDEDDDSVLQSSGHEMVFTLED